MTVQMYDRNGFVGKRDISSMREARDVVKAALISGHRDLTAEVVSEQGEVVAYYERVWTVK